MRETNTTNSLPAERRGNQIKLLVLWLVPVGLMAIAGLCYYLVQTGHMTIGSKNNGVLMRPPLQMHDLFKDLKPVNAIASDDQADSPWQGKWTLVVRESSSTGGSCDQTCRDNLHLSRQLHIRLDKNANRVQRILLGQPSNADAPFDEYLQREHRLVKRFSAGAASLAALDRALQNDAGRAARFFIVDPAGWAMMYYLTEHDGNAMLQDMKHLLKYSTTR